MKAHKSNINFSKITDYIYIGTNACCQIHFDSGLLKKGIKADISLERERLDQPGGVEYFLWLPTVDQTAPPQAKLAVGVRAMEELIKQKVKIYIHCRNGHGRAPTLAAAYFISQGMTVNEAIAVVKKKRPEIHLNTKQKNALKTYEQRNKKR